MAHSAWADVSWRNMVLSYDAACGESTPNEQSASNKAFAYHMQRMHLRPTLDVDLVNHCNLNCTCCCHFSPISKPGFLSLEAYQKDLELLARIEGVEEFFDAICLMGGEPLLHPQLVDCVRLTRNMLPHITVRLVTNGLLLADMTETFWEAMRTSDAEMLITAYPTGIDYDALVELARKQGVAVSLGGGITVSDAGEPYFLKTPLDDAGTRDTGEAFVVCPLAGATMQLLEGRIYPCNRGALFNRLNERFGTTFVHDPADYLELADITSAQEINAFRRTKKPMCRYCAHELTERVAWGQSTCSASEWLV